ELVLGGAVFTLFALLFLCYGSIFLVLRFTQMGRENRWGLVLIITALVLILLLAVLGVIRTFVRFESCIESWRCTMATITFGAVALSYVVIALLAGLFPRWQLWSRWLAPPYVALSLWVMLVVVVDNTIRFQFRETNALGFIDAYLPSWLALLGLGVL